LIEGFVNKNLELVIPITLHSAKGQPISVEATIDTGFDSYLKLSTDVIESLGLEVLYYAQFSMADDRVVSIPVYGGLVDWHGRREEIDILGLGEDNLVGCLLLSGSKLSASFVSGGRVELTAI